ncbi:hypothetical protein BGZ57DRAFT_990240 [Hyaloscypha finlandica]|nr:hypothetical protein BGZ57DRAFT_990240 [Hyaloscypha finlandica]
MKSSFSFTLILQALFAVGTFAVTKIIPTDPGTGPTTAEFYFGGTPFFDGPKIDIANETSFDWWYFDAVSSDGTYQLTVNFFTTLATTLGFATSFGTTNFAIFTAMYLNGTEYQQFGFAGPVTISGGLFGIKANWSGIGFTFQGTADLSYYKIIIDSPALGINGSVTFNPRTPIFRAKNLSEHLSPVIGWANAIPDSVAKVDFNLAGVGELKFTGSRYRDKINWGLQSLPQAVKSWYWGHGHMGPYSLVWFDTVNYDGTENVSGSGSRREDHRRRLESHSQTNWSKLYVPTNKHNW